MSRAEIIEQCRLENEQGLPYEPLPPVRKKRRSAKRTPVQLAARLYANLRDVVMGSPPWVLPATVRPLTQDEKTTIETALLEFMASRVGSTAAVVKGRAKLPAITVNGPDCPADLLTQ
jgi:hypothetical protein